MHVYTRSFLRRFLEQEYYNYYFLHSEPISYGRTKDRYITPEAGYLSFPKGAIVTVLSKEAVVDTTGREMWLAEVSAI